MKIRTCLTLSFVSLFLASCGTDSTSSNTQNHSHQVLAEQQLWEKIMAVHDEAMPKMADISRTKRRLKPHIKRSDLNEAQRQEIQETIELLESAEEAMNSWMNGLKMLPDLRKMFTHEQIMDYLNTELNNIKTVRTLMYDALEKGQRLLHILEPNNTESQ